MREINCPWCQSDNVGTVEHIIGTARISGLDTEGDPVYEGGTEVHWDSSTTQKDAQGRVRFACLSCGDEFTLDDLTP